MDLFQALLRTRKQLLEPQVPKPILTYCHDCQKFFTGKARHQEPCPTCHGICTWVY